MGKGVMITFLLIAGVAFIAGYINSIGKYDTFNIVKGNDGKMSVTKVKN